jgi:hypothetical protein
VSALLVPRGAVLGQSYLGLSLSTGWTSLEGDSPPGGAFLGRGSFGARLRAGLEVSDGVFLVAMPGYVNRGTHAEFRVPGSGSATASSELSIDYVTIPIGLRVRARNERLFVTSVLDFGRVLRATLRSRVPQPLGLDPGATPETGQDVLENLNPWDVSVGLTVGALIPVGGPKLSVELGWGQSLLNVTKSGFLPVDWNLPPRFKFSGFRLSAGVQFDLGSDGR